MPFYFFCLMRVCSLFIVLLSPLFSAFAQITADFDYQLAGDKRIAPVQVFDDGSDTYLQFRAGQVIPAIFSSHSSTTPMSYEIQGPYVFVSGTYSELYLRLQQITTSIRYTGKHSRRSVASAEPTEKTRPTSGSTDKIPDALVGAKSPLFEIFPSDKNLRLALARWAEQEGWVFNNDLWQVPVDMPITAPARFNGHFKHAIRSLLRATELSAHPLQPCFYSNKVLRVVPFSERCDRSRSSQ